MHPDFWLLVREVEANQRRQDLHHRQLLAQVERPSIAQRAALQGGLWLLWLAQRLLRYGRPAAAKRLSVH
jgi:hypothetical protein